MGVHRDLQSVTSVGATGTVTASAFHVRAVPIAIAKVSFFSVAGAWSAFLKALGCNWLVNLAVLLGYALTT